MLGEDSTEHRKHHDGPGRDERRMLERRSPFAFVCLHAGQRERHPKQKQEDRLLLHQHRDTQEHSRTDEPGCASGVNRTQQQ